VDDLNFCDLRRKPGSLNKEEQEKLRIGEYLYELFGNHSVRLVLLQDPCYYRGYGGSNAFLLYRKSGSSLCHSTAQWLFSRADNAVVCTLAI